MKEFKRCLVALMALIFMTNSVPVYGAQSKGAASVNRNEVSVESTGETGEEQNEAAYVDYEIFLDADKVQLEPGESVKLNVETDAPLNELSYKSLNPAVATVSSSGIVTAISGGSKGKASAGIQVSWTNPQNQQNSVSQVLNFTVKNTISLNVSSYTVYTGQKNTDYRLTAVTKPAGDITWSSSDTSIATVDRNGKITPKKTGKVTISASANGVKANCKVTVKTPSLKLKSAETVYLKNPVTLEAAAAPEGVVTWSSSDTRVAKVNARGVVTGLKTGTATIKAKANGITKSCKVTVKEPSITIATGNVWIPTGMQQAVFQGSSMQLYAYANPAVTVKWKSSNKRIATVDKNGKVTAVKPGTATITASIPGAKASYEIKVEKNPYKLNFSSRTMMVGSTETIYIKKLSGATQPSFYVEGDGSVSIETSGDSCLIRADAKGKSKITATFSVYLDGSVVVWEQSCDIKVVDKGVSTQQFSIAKNTKKKLKVKGVQNAQGIASIVWTSSAPRVASVDKTTGVVTGKAVGTAKITAQVTYNDGSQKSYATTMRVSNPKLKSSSMAVAVNGDGSIGLKGINSYSNIKWKSSKKSVLTVGANGSLIMHKKGSVTVTATIDGKVLKCKIYISNPKLKTDYAALTPGGNAQIALSGLSKKSKVTYKSSNPNVAVVSRSGLITGRCGGRATITVTADGKKFSYLVEVASQRALNACAEGFSIMSRSTYSQAYRMTEGYYDCSSLVFRAYGKDTALLGGSRSWAPTAANMAKYMAATGKVIAWGAVPVEELRPGDLIFYGGSNNGRYMGIYHVSMYYGNGYRLEKPLVGYYERFNTVMIARPVP